MSRPLARIAPSLAWKPSTRISVPGRSEFLFQPRRRSAFGAPPSTIHCSVFPSGVLTSMWIQECGLIHSIFVTTPRSLTGFFASNSAANEWGAITGTAAAATANAAPATTPNSLLRIGFISCLDPELTGDNLPESAFVYPFLSGTSGAIPLYPDGLSGAPSRLSSPSGAEHVPHRVVPFVTGVLEEPAPGGQVEGGGPGARKRVLVIHG